MIQVGTRRIGAGEKPFVIAEVGSNWSTLEDCKESIAKAASCGADAVKFQLLDERALYGVDVDAVRLAEARATVGGYSFQTVTSHDMTPIREMAKIKDWLPALAEKAKACGIEFMCSAFSPELYEAVNPYVNVHKVASAELTHLRILEKLWALGKPVILSTGASGEADIAGALQVLEGVPVVLLYCVAAYPARSSNPSLMEILRNTFHVPVGYSDHSTDVIAHAALARAGRAAVVEKHVNFVGATGPDAPHSLSTDEFKEYVQTLGGNIPFTLGPTREERGMILRHNRRLIATRDIPAGEPLKEGENFGIFRSLKDDTKAAHPFMVNAMNGKPVNRAIPAGDGIAPGDV